MGHLFTRQLVNRVRTNNRPTFERIKKEENAKRESANLNQNADDANLSAAIGAGGSAGSPAVESKPGGHDGQQSDVRQTEPDGLRGGDKHDSENSAERADAKNEPRVKREKTISKKAGSRRKK